MTNDWPPGSAHDAPTDHEGGVDPARRTARDWLSIGDRSALDGLAVHDHILGLEAELFEARAEIDELRSELMLSQNRRIARMADRACMLGRRLIPRFQR